MRVFASVGTHPQQFDRLLKELDSLALKNKSWKVFAQTGNSGYKPKNFGYKRFLNSQEYGKRIQEADIVVSHGGAGTIINSMLLGKKLVVVPRLEKFKEHTNNHQLDLAKALSRQGKVLAVERIQELGAVIKKAVSFTPGLASNKGKLIKTIAGFIDSA